MTLPCGQLRHLIEKAGQTAVKLQILPLQRGPHPAMGGLFTIFLRFAEPDLGDIIYIEQLTSALYLDRQVEVDSYLEVMNELCQQAEPPGRTAGILRRILWDVRGRAGRLCQVTQQQGFGQAEPARSSARCRPSSAPSARVSRSSTPVTSTLGVRGKRLEERRR